MDLIQSLRDEATYSTTFAKAQRLQKSGGVYSCDVEPSAIKGAVRLSGTVRSSAPGSTYRAWVSLRPAEGEVIDFGCTCPMGANAFGMCKHQIALALDYVYTGGSVRAAGEGTGDPYAAGAGRTSHRGASRPAYTPRTSSQVNDLISSLAAQRVEAAAKRPVRAARAAEPAEPVELLASIAPSATDRYRAGAPTTWLLKLKVRQGKTTYVVKNVADLVRSYLSGAEFSYGKKLSFAHVPEAFDERSRKVLELVCRIVRSQQALFLSRYNYMDAGRGADVKELPLSWSDAVELLDLYQGSTIGFEPGGYPPRPSRTLAVTKGNPQVKAELSPGPAQGYDLTLPPDLDAFATGDALYLLDATHAWRCTPEFAAKADQLFDMLLPAPKALYIGEKDLPEFCRSVLPTLSAVTDLEAPQALFDLVPPEPAFSFKIGLDDGEVRCQAFVAYGEERLGLYEPRRQGQPPRDLAAEYHAQDVVESYFHGTAGDLHFDEADDELLYVLLTDGLHDLGELGEVLLSERLRLIEARDSPQVRVKATVKSGLLDVAVDSSGMSARDLMAYLESYKRKQNYVRLSNGDIVKIGNNLQALDSLAEGLGVDVAELAGGVDGLPQNKTLFVDALLKKVDRVRLDRSQSFRAIVREFETFSDADIEMPASLDDVLRGYQVAGVRWLGTLERFGFGGILADDMGLGKTLQVIAHILACKEAREAAGAGAAAVGFSAGAASPGDTAGAAAGTNGDGSEKPRETTLIVAPASLVYNWCAELERFAPALDAVAVVGTAAVRKRIIGAAAEHDVLVTSYDLMKRDVKAYAGQHFRRVVLDEAQYIKNAGTQAAKCAKCLPSDVRFALTGTPIENRLAELWSIFDFLMPGVLGSRDDFAKRFESPVEHGEAEATHRLQCLVAPFILRRLKADVLADLPEKTESVVIAKMGDEQDMLYRANQDRVALQIQHKMPDEFKKEKLKILAELTKLRQICCDPRLFYEDYAGGSAKLDACVELVRNAVDGGHKVLVFSQFTSMLDLLGDALHAQKLDYLLLKGSTSKEERRRLVDEFQGGGAPVFLISLKAGGVGLNLTAADVVIHYDPWWNLAAQNQATDRAHRIGQERSVSVFKLICQGTIEERIVQMQERKADLAEAVLGGEGLSSTRITQEDVLALLGAGA